MDVHIQTPQPQFVPDGWSPNLAVYGGNETVRRYLPLSLLVAQLPNFEKYLPPFAQFIPTCNIIFADTSDTVLAKFVELLLEGQTSGNEDECREVYSLLREGGVNLDLVVLDEIVEERKEVPVIKIKRKKKIRQEEDMIGEDDQKDVERRKRKQKKKELLERLAKNGKEVTKASVKEHQCSYCLKYFQFPSTLKNHLSSSHGFGKKILALKNV